jgi:MFS family permease
VPLIVGLYSQKNNLSLNVPLLSFLVIAIGSIGCAIGGYISVKKGSAKVATAALFISGICCLLSPLIFQTSPFIFLFILFVWGFTVIPDSPQFSTLVAQYAPDHLRGTALTIYNSIGFSISTISLITIDYIFHSKGFFGGQNTFLLLGAGAIVGLPSMIRLIKFI